MWDYLSRFTDWHYFMYRVKAVIDGEEVNIPFNLDSLYKVFPHKLATDLEAKLIKNSGSITKCRFCNCAKAGIPIWNFWQSMSIKRFFRLYDKAVGVTPEELDPSVSGRVPVYVSRDNRYFQDKYQAIPARGYTEMAQNMLNHPLIRVELNTDFADIREKTLYERLFYSGPIDEFFLLNWESFLIAVWISVSGGLTGNIIRAGRKLIIPKTMILPAVSNISIIWERKPRRQ